VAAFQRGKKFIADTVAQFGKNRYPCEQRRTGTPRGFWTPRKKIMTLSLNVNLKGSFFIAQAFVEASHAAKAGGKVINIIPWHEELPFPHFASYCASKAESNVDAQSINRTCPLGITITTIAPGAIETPINTKLLNDPVKLNALLDNIPLKRLGKPEDCGFDGRVPGVIRIRLRDRNNIFCRRGLTWNYQEQ